MSKKFAVVVTTIGDGAFLEEYIAAAKRENVIDDVAFIVISDLKSPQSLYETCRNLSEKKINIICPSMDEQDEYCRKLNIDNIIPYNSNNRRNIGFLMAYEHGYDILVTIDDDNIPVKEHPYFTDHGLTGIRLTGTELSSSNGWYNICELMSVSPEPQYARGFPYRHRHESPDLTTREINAEVHINAGLWTGHPDIDAVGCLFAPACASNFKGESYILGKSTWTPVNTQNTSLIREAIPTYYYQPMGHNILGTPLGRYGDIFSGYYLQACTLSLGGRIRVGSPAVDHQRNVHNYMKDLTAEVAGMWILEDLTEWLHDVSLEGKTYIDTYLSLIDLMEDEIGHFTGFIWTDETRKYFQYIILCMRTWINAVNTINGKV